MSVPSAAALPARPTRRLSPERRETISGYLFILPAVLGFLLWTAGPMAYSAWVSLTDWDLLSPPRFVGLDNYRRMFDDKLFWTSLRVTFVFTLLAAPLFQLFSFVSALLLNIEVRGVALFRTLYYLPTVVPLVASSVLWSWIYNSEFGLLNSVLRAVGLPKLLWLQDTDLVTPALVIMILWGVGGTMVIYLAGLQGIPAHLYEAAEIDGAGPWQRLVNVTIPMMSPIIFFNFVLGLIAALQTFAQAYIITDGGPRNATLFYAVYLYRRAFRDFQMGYAAALAWVLFAIVLAISLLVFRSLGRTVYYEDDAR